MTNDQRMTNSKCRMMKEVRPFVIRHSTFSRHSSFVIRHSFGLRASSFVLSCRHGLITALVLLGTLTSLPQTSAGPATQASLAVVRLPSHGASATVIATEPGKTLILSCGHAFHGKDRARSIVVDVPTTRPLPPRTVGTELLKVNYEDDLSLILLRAGPVDFSCPVAPPGHYSVSLQSVGYDEMQLPAKVLPAHIVSLSPQVTYTRERPWHGRSGGALIDADAGYLIGVVQGYELDGQRRRMYVSHAAVLRFLERFRQEGI